MPEMSIDSKGCHCGPCVAPQLMKHASSDILSTNKVRKYSWWNLAGTKWAAPRACVSLLDHASSNQVQTQCHNSMWDRKASISLLVGPLFERVLETLAE